MKIVKNKVNNSNVLKTYEIDRQIKEKEKSERKFKCVAFGERPQKKLSGKPLKIQISSRITNNSKQRLNFSEKQNGINRNKDSNNTDENKYNKKIEISLENNDSPNINENKNMNNNINLSERNSINKIVKENSKYINRNNTNRLNYNKTVFYIILFLNIFLPGIGTIIAAIGWGNSTIKNRTKELIIRGVIQILTIIFLVGWVQAIINASNYFEKKSLIKNFILFNYIYIYKFLK